MAYLQVQDAAVATGDGTVFHPLQEGNPALYSGKVKFSITIGDTATVLVKGRVHPGAPWQTLDTVSSSESAEVDAYTDMKCEITVWVAGTVDAWVQF